MIKLLRALLWCVETILGLMIGYLLVLTGAAALSERRTAMRGSGPTHRFLFLVPAHNEEKLLPDTLASIRALDYPPELYAVHVVADNCTDRTAELAREGGAIAHERFDAANIGKGHALRWLLGRIWQSRDPHDAIVILDADTVVSPNFLAVMDARLARGERAIQAYYAVRASEQSRNVGLRAVALTLLHYVRPQGRMALGGSAGLKGNGMVFAADIARRYPWPNSLTEDIEYHMELLLGGELVTFAPDATVWAEMPDTLAAAQSQNARWERGRLDMLRRYAPRLLASAWRERRFALADAAVEQAIPPFSIVTAASVACLLAGAALRSARATIAGGFLVGGQTTYVLGGLALAGAPAAMYRALLAAPTFILWKVWLYARVLAGRDAAGWVRTARNDAEI